jgi:hypothetical protein
MLFTLIEAVMPAQPSKSEEVIADYKKHKLARSALRRIHELLKEFEQERALDRKLAGVGLALIALLIAVSLFWLSTAGSTVLR